MVKKRDGNENMTVPEVVITSETPEATSEEIVEARTDEEYEELLASAQEIRKNEDVIGYILRGQSKATVDLAEPEKIIEYAMLSSQAYESSGMLTETFNLGEVRNIIVQGKNAKLVCFSVGENKLSVFLKKAASHDWLLSKIFVQTDR
jgi:predicted regulator of Ras-like GTPase activity (Roadblock/LC7/MglB family)